MPASLVVSLRGDVHAITQPEGDILLEWPGGRIIVPRPGPGLAAAIRQLADTGAPEDVLVDSAVQGDGVGDVARLYYHLTRWGQLGLLRYTLAADGQALATLEPLSPQFTYKRCEAAPGTRYVLSRFAYCRRDGASLVLESPRAFCRIVFTGAVGAALLSALAQPAGLDDLTVPHAQPLLNLLLGAGMLSPAGEGAADEDRDAALRQWEFHDLLFHSRSRAGRAGGPYAGTYSYLDEIPALPAVKPAGAGAMIPLDRPDLAALGEQDAPLTAVLERRRSVRAYGEHPITLTQLGAFLYRTARVRRVMAPTSGTPYETSSRPYPAGGACYELELYAAVNRCEGLDPGLYHYDPLPHALRRVRDMDAPMQDLLNEWAWVTAPCPLQIAFGITARFQRVSWKYRGMAYAVMLKDLGALYQTMYLVAESMGLAPCAVGGGSTDLLARTIGAEYHVESAIGEFLLGSRPPGRGG